MNKKVIDPNGKEREVSSITKVPHMVQDVVNEEEEIEQTYVEVEIVGRNHNWREWWNWEDFKKLNPKRRLRWK